MKGSILYVLGGALLGVLLVRALLLDPLELIAWSVFWSTLFEGNLMNPEVLLESTTFWKSVGGAVVGGAAGYVWKRRSAASAAGAELG